MMETTEGIAGLVTLKAAARLLGCTPQSLGERIRRYQVPTVRLGKNVLVRLSELRATYPDARRP